MTGALARSDSSTVLGASQSRSGTDQQTNRAALTVGLVGLIAVVACILLVCAGAASGPTPLVPARSGGWYGWMAGPLSSLGVSIDLQGFQTLTLIMCGGYALVLICARALPWLALAGAIVAAHLILLLGPPLLSQDVFGYLAFARMGVLHGLDPYTHFAAQAAGDPTFDFLGWPFLHSPYGPLFTLSSYGTAPLGLAGGLWALKAVTVLSSLGAIALTARAAAVMGRSSRAAAAFVGLNPVLLELAVGGQHNDTLVLAAQAGALLALASTSVRPRAAAAVLALGVGVKASAGLLLPFLVLSERDWRARARLALSVVGALVLLALVALVGFGSHALGFVSALGEQQQIVATHSIPAETARLFGLQGTPGWWRHLFIVAFVVVLLYACWRTARGADWRAAGGWCTLAALCCTAWLLPWYAIWVLPLTALSRDRRLYAATLLFCAYALAIHLPLADPLLTPAR